MNVTITQNENDGSYNLLYAGKAYLVGESYAVVNSVRDALLGVSSGISEADEVADAIKHGKAERIRLHDLVRINSEAAKRTELEARVGQVWNTDELQRDFEAVGFLAPYVVVRRKSDGVVGSLTFQHNPRLYFSFREDRQ